MAKKTTGQIRKATGRRKGVAAEGPVTIGVPLVDPDWYVTVEKGSRVGERFPMVSRLTIGRNDDNVLVLEDDMVSRNHAVIERHTGRYMVRDLGSRLGTTLNGEPVSETAALVNGDVLVLGATHLRVSGPPEPTTIDHNELDLAKTIQLACSRCGKRLRASDRFCGSCGEKRQ